MLKVLVTKTSQRSLSKSNRIYMKQAIISTLLHVLELSVSMAAAWAIMLIFDLDDGSIGLLIAMVLNAMSKFTRSSSLPVKDWVNNEK